MIDSILTKLVLPSSQIRTRSPAVMPGTGLLGPLPVHTYTSMTLLRLSPHARHALGAGGEG